MPAAPPPRSDAARPTPDAALETAARTALDRATAGIDGPLGLAVSGGSDSMALLHLAARWAADGRALRVATVDHRLRPEAAAEAETVGRAAATFGLAHETLVLEALGAWAGAGGPGNLQERAREHRLAALRQWAQTHGLAAVLLGHTLDDRAETLLLRLARGSGLDGLAAMAPAVRRDGVLWLRPLLGLRREALRGWLAGQGIGWHDDPSNDDPRFDRVRARRALATLEPLGLTAEGLAATAARLDADRAVADDAARRLRDEAVVFGTAGEVRLDVAAMERALGPTRLRVLGRLCAALSGRAHVPRRAALERFWESAAAGARTTLAGLVAERRGAAVTLAREPSALAPPVPADAGAVWDGRWRLLNAREGLSFGPLGRTARARLKAGAGPRPPEDWWRAPLAQQIASPALLRPDGSLAALANPPLDPDVEDLAIGRLADALPPFAAGPALDSDSPGA